MMNRAFASAFAVIFIVSILEVTTFNSKEVHDESAHDDFREFHDEADPSFEYSKEASKMNAKHTFEDDLTDSTSQDADQEDIEIRQPTGIKSSAFKAPPIDMPPVRFSFCVSCGYRQAFDQLSQVLREKFPGIEIEGANFPPTQIKALLAQFIGFAKIALIVMIIMGRDPFVSLGMQTPSFFTWMLSNKLSSCLMLFMLSNSVEGMLMSTGAFEIFIGEELVWSKMESGRPPSPAELIQAIESQMAIRGSGASKLAGATAGPNSAEFSFET